MAQPHMPVSSVEDPEIQGSPGNGSSSSWIKEAQAKIHKEAEAVTLSIPPYFPRLDSIGSTLEYPSIFKPRHRAAVGVAPMPTLPQAAAPSAPYPAGAAASSIMVAAVGPYHRPSTYSLITDAKKCAIVEFLASQGSGSLDTANFLRWAQNSDARVRSCYEPGSFTVSSDPSKSEEDKTMKSEELAKMLLLDGCLLLFAVFLLRSSVHAPPLAHDAVRQKQFNYLSADMCRNMKQTRLDLLKLSNQIPFFVLAELHRRLKDTFFEGIRRSIEELALSCFDDIHPPLSGVIKQAAKAGETIPFPKTVHHLLHLFHWSRVPQGKHMLLNDSPSLHAEPESHLPCATWFEEWRTSFSEQAAPGGSSLHIVFKRKMMDARGVMHVPAQRIYGYSDSVFRNLIAFEQSNHHCGLGVTAYSICMARLLQTEADTKLLRERGILAHTHQSDKEIVDLFTGLADEYINTFYSKDLLRLCKDVSAHHKSTAAKAIKWVRLQCFPRQSVTFFVIFGALISFATVINTGYSVYRFYHPLPLN